MHDGVIPRPQCFELLLLSGKFKQLFVFSKESRKIWKTKHFDRAGSKMTPSCKWPIVVIYLLRSLWWVILDQSRAVSNGTPQSPPEDDFVVFWLRQSNRSLLAQTFKCTLGMFHFSCCWAHKKPWNGCEVSTNFWNGRKDNFLG